MIFRHCLTDPTRQIFMNQPFRLKKISFQFNRVTAKQQRCILLGIGISCAFVGHISEKLNYLAQMKKADSCHFEGKKVFIFLVG